MLTTIKRACLFCKKDFFAIKSEVNRGHGMYCSSYCARKSTSKEDNRVCKTCGKTFKAKPCEIKKGHALFCSRECWIAESRRECICQYCGKAFSVTRYDLKRGRGKYCSQSCSHAFFKGENSPNFVHGKWSLRSRWPEAVKSKNILNRAIAKGEIKRQPCQICGYPNGHGHHEDYNEPLKVVWLCSKHHMRLHAEKRLA